MKKLVILSIICCLVIAAPMAFSMDEPEARSSLRIDYRIAMPILVLSRGDNLKDDVDLATENTSYLGIQYSTRGFSIGLSSYVLFGGENRLREIFLSWFGERAGLELFHQNYRDFYIANNNWIGKKYSGTPNEYPDLKIMNTGLSGYWFFRDNNFRGLNTQEESLLVNSWSPFIKTTIARFTLDNDYPLLPEDLRDNYHKTVRTMNRADFHQLSVSVGLTGTYTWKRFYVSGLMTTGLAPTKQQWETVEGKSYGGYTLVDDVDVQVMIGYIGKDFFSGLWFINDNQCAKAEDLTIQLVNYQMSLFAGLRF